MNVERRLYRLERQNRRLKHGMVGMILAGLSLLVMAQALPTKEHDVIVAKKFVLKDGEGRVRARLWSGALSPNLTFYSSTGSTPNSLTAHLTGGALYLYSPSIGGRAVLAVDGQGMGFETSFKGKRVISVFAKARFNAQGKKAYGEGQLIQYNRAGEPSRVWPGR